MKITKDLVYLAKHQNILLVDDDVDINRELYDILSLYYKDVKQAFNGKEGLELYKNNKFDILITDISMPEMDGIEMMKNIKEINPEQKFIVMTAHNETQYLTQLIDIDVDGYLLKPYTREQLFRLLTKLSRAVNMVFENNEYKCRLEELVDKQTQEIVEKSNLITKKIEIDDVSGLYSREKLLKDLYKYKENEVILILTDIDNFNHFNHTYGLRIGDLLLNAVANRIKDEVGSSYKVYRIGSDEFVLIKPNNTLDDALDDAKHIQDSIYNHIFRISDFDIRLSISIGIATGNKSDISKEISGSDICKKAHIALQDAKAIHNNKIAIYTSNSDIERQHKDTLYWIHNVKNAIEHDWLIPYVQPIFNIKTKKIEKYECLSRIEYEKKVIEPIHFLEPAKIAGILPNLTKTMMQRSFEYFAHHNGEFSINITSDDLMDDYLAEFLIDLSTKYNIEPKRVVLEILENISDYNTEHSMDQLQLLKDYGFALAIDDFGAQNSNFSRIHNLNVDYIKIDGVFIRDIDINESSYKIVKAIVNFAKSIEVKTIAEFVSTKEIYDKIVELDIDYAQGYYIGKPISTIEHHNNITTD